MSDSLPPHGLQPIRLLCPWDFPGTSARVECHFLLQGIFLTQESDLGLLHCRQTLYRLSHQGILTPNQSFFLANIFSHSTCCLFVLCFMYSAKFLTLIRFHLLLFFCLRKQIPQKCATVNVKEWSTYFVFLGVFMVSSLMFRSLSQFELFLCMVLDHVIVSLHAAIQFSPHHLLKKSSFLHSMF